MQRLKTCPIPEPRAATSNTHFTEWSSLLDQAIDEMLEDSTEVVSEREAFLLRELQSKIEAEGLLAKPNDVVVVAARSAWKEYNDIHA
ncbi:hypothetical protein SH528x_003847 [Novipirellula sp. SH528]|uniref:hypothetical protein n=1 Tax=Novipirellula sp. SH528 TaxID=3454466 RepID=UPI003FA0CF1F